MELKEKHCWREIDVDAVKSNYELIKKISDKPFYTVVKANAYGHGAKYMAKIYQELDTFGFCVSSFDEAMELRHSGVTRPILILGYTDPGKAYHSAILTEFDGSLYTSDARTSVWTGKAAFTKLEQGKEYEFIVEKGVIVDAREYREDGAD